MHQHQALTRVPERIERARLDQRLDHSLVTHHQRNLAQEIGEPVELALRLARRDDRVHHVGAHVADRRQAEPDVGADRREHGYRLVDVGRQHLDAHPAALTQVQRRLVLVVGHRGEQRGHVLGRVIGLQVRGPVRDQAVGGGVRLVERVPGERYQDVPDGLDGLVGVAAFPTSLLERQVLLVEDLLLLLAHGPAEQVGLAECVAGQDLGRLLHLFLVDDQAVSRLEHLP